MYKIAIDKYLCSGCGKCVRLFPDVFEKGIDGNIQVKTIGTKEMINSCNNYAIKIVKE